MKTIQHANDCQYCHNGKTCGYILEITQGRSDRVDSKFCRKCPSFKPTQTSKNNYNIAEECDSFDLLVAYLMRRHKTSLSEAEEVAFYIDVYVGRALGIRRINEIEAKEASERMSNV